MLSRSVSDRNRRVLLVLAVAGVYFAGAKVGLSLAFFASQVTPVWPASGIALAAVILFGRSVLPGIWLGALLVNASLGEPILAAVCIATGNMLEAIVAFQLLWDPLESTCRHASLSIL